MKTSNFFRYSAFLLILGSLLFTSCKDDDDNSAPPGIKNKSCFTFSNDDGTVTFDASCSKNAVKYTWNFGNGDEVSQIVPKVNYFYAEPGTYTVTLLSTFGSGDVLTTSHQVMVDEICLICTCSGPWSGGVDEVACGTSKSILSTLCSPLCTSNSNSEVNCYCSYK